jgi:phosphoglycolate phosphatase-like HAD superfamily hydrolase
VVTNKPGWLTDPLMKDLQLYDRALCVISGDTLQQRKPHPAPLLYACQLANCRPEQCLYVGDAQRDIEAGRNAGMHTMIALFGYFTDQDQPHSWGATHMIEAPRELLAWLDNEHARD